MKGHFIQQRIQDLEIEATPKKRQKSGYGNLSSLNFSQMKTSI